MLEQETANAVLNNLPMQLGVAVLLLGAFYVFAKVVRSWMKSESDKWQETVWQQARESEQRQAKEKAIYDKIIETIRLDRDKDQQILMSALEDNRQQISVLRSVVEKMKSHDRAVQVLLDKTSRILENRCINQLKKS